MERNTLERVTFVLLKVFGILTILGSFLDKDKILVKQDLILLNHKSIFGKVYMLSPKIMVGMLVSIIIYLIFIRFLEKNFRILRRQ